MGRILFDPETIDWSDFLSLQHGGAYYFEGTPYQRGFGIGSVFSSLLKYLIPIGKAVGRELGKEGLATWSRILGDISSGQDIKTALSSESTQGLKNLAKRAYEKSQGGTGKKGIKRSVKFNKAKEKFIKQAKIGPPKRVDYFGPY